MIVGMVTEIKPGERRSSLTPGGFKESGYGKDLSVYSLDDYRRVKHAMVKLE